MKFKPEDFYSGDAIVDEAPLLSRFFKSLGRDCADQANARLVEMLKEAPEVRGLIFQDPVVGIVHVGFDDSNGGSLRPPQRTHTARLVDIQEIGEKG